jgi:hypothetical protein
VEGKESFTVESNEFDEKEKAMLKALYEASDGTYSSYTLAQKLNPEVSPSAEDGRIAFEAVRDTTEGLIVRDLVRGERHTGANGVYFDKLKLTPKGERKAIEAKRVIRVTVTNIGQPEES